MPDAASENAPPGNAPPEAPPAAGDDADEGPGALPADPRHANGNAHGDAAPDEPEDESDAAALPDRFADGTMRRLEPEIRTIWMLKLGAALLLGTGALFFYELLQWLSAEPGAVAAWRFWPSGLLLAASVAAGVGVPRMRYRYWRYALRPEELYLERGIFNRVRTVVPLRRIQHVDVSQDLFEREFDLGKLIVHTAGGRSSDVAVPGLRYETAERLRDDVKHYVLGDDAV